MVYVVGFRNDLEVAWTFPQPTHSQEALLWSQRKDGEYWDRQTQIDVVGVRTDGWTDIGECKWSGQGAPMAFARELIARAAAAMQSLAAIREAVAEARAAASKPSAA